MKRMEYVVSNVKTPKSERVCRNLSEVSSLIGACRSVVQRRLVNGYCTMNGWKVVKRFTAETEKPKLGSIADEFYWSSSEDCAIFAWRQDFRNGGQNDYDRDNIYCVRPARCF